MSDFLFHVGQAVTLAQDFFDRKEFSDRISFPRFGVTYHVRENVTWADGEQGIYLVELNNCSPYAYRMRRGIREVAPEPTFSQSYFIPLEEFSDEVLEELRMLTEPVLA